MQLTRSQRQLLDEMGITVWVNRQTKSDSVPSETVQPTAIPNSDISHIVVTPLVVVTQSSPMSDAEQRFLHSLLKVILPVEEPSFIAANEYQLVKDSLKAGTVVIAIDPEICDSESYTFLERPYGYLLSLRELSAVMTEAKNKQQLWQAIKLYRRMTQ
jgi:hypothetical protein